MLQEIYTKGIEELESVSQARFQKGFKDLEREQQNTVWRRMDRGFRDTEFEHTVEGMYAAPEYGGNQGLVGWKYIHYEGDRQPIGYTRKQMEEPDEELGATTLSKQKTDEAVAFLQSMVKRRQGRSV